MNKKDIIKTLTILKSQKLINSYNITIEKKPLSKLYEKYNNKYKIYNIFYKDYNNKDLFFCISNEYKNINLKDILYKQILINN